MRGLLKSPSAYEKEPEKYLLNQIGHAYLVGFAPVFAFGWEAIPAIAMVYVFWEFLQFCWFDAKLSDCLEDTGHVLTGAFVALFPVAAIPHLVLVAAGWQWRRENAA
jgi:hypothetical protein